MGLHLIAASTFWSDAGSILLVVLGVGLVHFVHELGHFLVAKACGVKCEKFYVGFDPRIKIGPIGPYVLSVLPPLRDPASTSAPWRAD